MPLDNNPDSVVDRYFDDLDDEFAATRRLLERFPAEHADWKPHEKSMTLAVLATHVATLPGFAAPIVDTDDYQMETAPRQPTPARTAAELVAMHDRSVAAAHEAMARMSPERMTERWRFLVGERVIIDDRRGRVLRQHLISHVAHHRGQITVYYRLLGVPVPGLYGRSADDLLGASK